VDENPLTSREPSVVEEALPRGEARDRERSGDRVVDVRLKWCQVAGRAAHRAVALELGANEFVGLARDRLEDVGEVDVVLDVFGEIRDRSTALVREGGTLVTIASPPATQPRAGRAIFFVVEPDRHRLADLAQRVRRSELRPLIATTVPLADAPSAPSSTKRGIARTIVLT
jgi:NADPH:quinone reductase-like Zn-dependent oxidoreductase